MPQKRNPVALEHARAIASTALGQASAIALSVHNTPFGDIVDTEDDLQPLVFSMFRDAGRAVSLVGAAMATAEFDAAALEARAGDGWTTLTELADTLVREHGLPFRAAHAIAARLIKARAEDSRAPLAALLAAASREISGEAIEYTEPQLATILSPRHFVNVRKTLGGPAPEVTARAAEASRLQLEADEGWLKSATAALAEAERRLADRCEAL
jgi:argininosuccinate lyase